MSNALSTQAHFSCVTAAKHILTFDTLGRNGGRDHIHDTQDAECYKLQTVTDEITELRRGDRTRGGI